MSFYPIVVIPPPSQQQNLPNSRNFPQIKIPTHLPLKTPTRPPAASPSTVPSAASPSPSLSAAATNRYMLEAREEIKGERSIKGEEKLVD
ncbi:hypothetical protein ES332_A11G289100v1 [Gossypium tomentosum]|uniref:Uncharacterized protein n=1 Tax=Gossypium tomentosum TaxID=34277 RepID=A0A5D2NFV7_GOSTO|nr:hypothetical protein ES332_A11G289100v1 [Gossypium tomentosum]